MGVVIGIKPKSIYKIDNLINKLNNEFSKKVSKKENIVKILKKYLGKFDHIELDKSLDSKM